MATLGIGRPTQGKGASKHPRQRSSSAYQLFDAAQVQTFREAFNLIDQDNDGVISESDLKGLLTSLGQQPSPAHLSSLLSSRPPNADPSLPAGQLNFTSFVTLMASHLSALDPEHEMLEAFASFDETNSGFVKADEMRDWLRAEGDRMSDEEVDALLHPPFLDRKTGLFNYRLFCSTLRVTDEGDDEPALADEPVRRT
ncbi:uncharacterized protein JCM10292_006974 [Rhodotorula paludigena]|uniref:uncharacterized protein n=1 Tax=Rhodotorula paludigena TaxID=86838 RepID=UPI00317C6988